MCFVETAPSLPDLSTATLGSNRAVVEFAHSVWQDIRHRPLSPQTHSSSPLLFFIRPHPPCSSLSRVPQRGLYPVFAFKVSFCLGL